MRPIDKGNCPTDNNGNSITVSDHKEWREQLGYRIGYYCGYCNSPLHYNLNIEHVVPINPPLGYQAGDELEWDNILLACGPCNLKKSNQIIDTNLHYFPELNNTHIAFDISVVNDYAMVIPSNQLTAAQQTKAQITITDLFGLDVVTKEDKVTDLRWHYRKLAFVAAAGAYDDYILIKNSLPQQSAKSITSIINYAKSIGFWSIWFNQFITEPDVLQALLDTSQNGFPGTDLNCFDTANGYQPVPRNPGNPIDSI